MNTDDKPSAGNPERRRSLREALRSIGGSIKRTVSHASRRLRANSDGYEHSALSVRVTKNPSYEIGSNHDPLQEAFGVLDCDSYDLKALRRQLYIIPTNDDARGKDPELSIAVSDEKFQHIPDLLTASEDRVNESLLGIGKSENLSPRTPTSPTPATPNQEGFTRFPERRRRKSLSLVNPDGDDARSESGVSRNSFETVGIGGRGNDDAAGARASTGTLISIETRRLNATFGGAGQNLHITNDDATPASPPAPLYRPKYPDHGGTSKRSTFDRNT